MRVLAAVLSLIVVAALCDDTRGLTWLAIPLLPMVVVMWRAANPRNKSLRAFPPTS